MPKKNAVQRRLGKMAPIIRSMKFPKSSDEARVPSTTSDLPLEALKSIKHFTECANKAFEEFGLDKRDPLHRWFCCLYLAGAVYSKKTSKKKWTKAKRKQAQDEIMQALRLRPDALFKQVLHDVSLKYDVDADALRKQLGSAPARTLRAKTK
jgi:hypothetical protein